MSPYQTEMERMAAEIRDSKKKVSKEGDAITVYTFSLPQRVQKQIARILGQRREDAQDGNLESTSY